MKAIRTSLVAQSRIMPWRERFNSAVLAIWGLPASNVLVQKPKTASAKPTLSTPLPKRKIFPFASLPAELKNAIYIYALTDANSVFLVSKRKQHRRTVKRDTPHALLTSSCGYYHRGRFMHPRPAESDATSTLRTLVPNLLLVNRQIYSEAQPILYGQNAFALEDTMALHAFLANIGPRNVAALADVTIKGWGYTKAHKALNYPALTLLAGAVDLKRLKIDCRISWYTCPKKIAMQVYREAFHWLKAIGVAKRKRDAALEVIEIREENFSASIYGTVSVKDLPSHQEQMENFREVLSHLLR